MRDWLWVGKRHEDSLIILGVLSFFLWTGFVLRTMPDEILRVLFSVAGGLMIGVILSPFFIVARSRRKQRSTVTAGTQDEDRSPRLVYVLATLITLVSVAFQLAMVPEKRPLGRTVLGTISWNLILLVLVLLAAELFRRGKRRGEK
jgi:hypothetical protein